MPLRHVVLLVVMLAVAGGCTSSKTKPPPTTVATSTTVEETTTTTALVTVPGRPRPTTTLPTDILGGQARISGTVSGPQGLVTTATVRVERLVGSHVATMDVVATGGMFSLSNVNGGHYRVRAWNRPDLLEPDPETFFLAADENKTIDLKVVRVADLNLQTTVDPNPPPASDPFTAVVFVYAVSVSDQGTLLATPRASLPVLLTVGSGLQIQGAPMSVTDASGKVAYRLRCLAAGPQGADLILANVRMSLGLPPCP